MSIRKCPPDVDSSEWRLKPAFTIMGNNETVISSKITAEDIEVLQTKFPDSFCRDGNDFYVKREDNEKVDDYVRERIDSKPIKLHQLLPEEGAIVIEDKFLSLSDPSSVMGRCEANPPEEVDLFTYDADKYTILDEPLSPKMVNQIRALADKCEGNGQIKRIKDSSSYLVARDTEFLSSAIRGLTFVGNNIKNVVEEGKIKNGPLEDKENKLWKVINAFGKVKKEVQDAESGNVWKYLAGLVGLCLFGFGILSAWGHDLSRPIAQTLGRGARMVWRGARHIWKRIFDGNDSNNGPQNPGDGTGSQGVRRKGIRENSNVDTTGVGEFVYPSSATEYGSSPTYADNVSPGMVRRPPEQICNPNCGQQESIGTNTFIAEGLAVYAVGEIVGAGGVVGVAKNFVSGAVETVAETLGEAAGMIFGF